ncbi:hypothetical protein ACFVYR_37335 [Streptomyces sp. NPDC058284]|uniref:hypothetical protein n=1 Tax=unclassified Streptomyces TaxID=2593676 RepID=UPI00365BB721
MTKTRNAELRWEREEDQDWADTVHVRLALDEEAPAGFAEEILAEAHQLVAEAGQPAVDVLGDPVAYARTVAKERVSERYRAGIDTHGMRPGDRVVASFGTFGFLVFALFGLYWIQDGLWIGISWASLAGSAAVVVAVSLLCLAFIVRSAGRLRGMWAFLAGMVAAIAGGSAIAAAMPEGELFRVPAPVVMLIGAAWAACAFLLPEDTINSWFTPARADGGSDDERWLARLEGLLRGRHGMRAAEARGHVREARQHLAGDPEAGPAKDVFGDVEIYAMRLSAGPRRKQRIARQKLTGSLLSSLFFAALAVDLMLDAERGSGWLACYIGAFGCSAWAAVGEWRELRKLRRAPETRDEKPVG